MIKIILFDLDGVIYNAKTTHYSTLNKALELKSPEYMITWEEHIKKYDGLKTSQKLEMLTKEKGLPKEYHEEIWRNKQLFTLEAVRDLKPDERLRDTLYKIRKDGIRIGCCSNSIRRTLLSILGKLDIIEFFDVVFSNEDVKYSKPHPEMYWRGMAAFGTLPETTLIVEDSPHGLLAAYRSGAHIMRVRDVDDVNYDNIKRKLNEIKRMSYKNLPKWKDTKMNVLIPMAGAGSRFEKQGYTFPKPLIDVRGKPMIQVVVDNLNIDAHFIFIVQKSHREKYNLDTLLNLIAPGCTIVETEGVTEGAACSALLAKEYINNDAPLFFANSDQFVEWNSNEFLYKMQENGVDGGIVTFESTHPKWSFCKVDENGFVTEVAEKNPISNIATVGYYYWKHGSDFVKYAEQMIHKNIRVNNEFYVAPTFNEAILDNKKFQIFNVERMWGIGTPEDLRYFLENYKN
jgi:HAD superfamily hydrolase (TIGR01509 family)